MKPKYLLFLGMVLTLEGCLPTKSPQVAPTLDELPNALLPAFEQNDLKTQYTLNPNLNPFYLQENFDGDSTADYAVFLQNKHTQKPAIAFVLGANPAKAMVVAEGQWPALKDFKEIAYWKATPHFPAGAGSVLPGIKGGGLVLDLRKPEAVRWVYWNGQQWQCINPE
ncbi:hypothetical protein [Rufibacter hautae]|uniref:Uncharacterized protein n=1 Tax=Rufibacter hautae TaxID=2595005 RepID=A0A5B6TID3_9BACT|nr:hypothetical protein [Rufibacter hautae]KAA3439766.1 hypothetical protein FOA19_03555 [Rufibacter hautae]